MLCAAGTTKQDELYVHKQMEWRALFSFSEEGNTNVFISLTLGMLFYLLMKLD